jgi:hypothetical protein
VATEVPKRKTKECVDSLLLALSNLPATINNLTIEIRSPVGGIRMVPGSFVDASAVYSEVFGDV